MWSKQFFNLMHNLIFFCNLKNTIKITRTNARVFCFASKLQSSFWLTQIKNPGESREFKDILDKSYRIPENPNIHFAVPKGIRKNPT